MLFKTLNINKPANWITSQFEKMRAEPLNAKAIGFVQLDLIGQDNLHKTYCGGVED